MMRRPPAANRNHTPQASTSIAAGTSDSAAPGGERDRKTAGLAARRAVIEILVRVETRGAFADVLLGHRLADFAAADRRLTTKLVLGVLAWRMRLDYELAQICTQPLEK